MTMSDDDSAVLGVAALTHRLTELEVGDTGGTENRGYDRRGPRERAELSDRKRKRDERRRTRVLFYLCLSVTSLSLSLPLIPPFWPSFSLSVFLYVSLAPHLFSGANAVYAFSFNPDSTARLLCTSKVVVRSLEDRRISEHR